MEVCGGAATPVPREMGPQLPCGTHSNVTEATTEAPRMKTHMTSFEPRNLSRLRHLQLRPEKTNFSIFLFSVVFSSHGYRDLASALGFHKLGR